MQQPLLKPLSNQWLTGTDPEKHASLEATIRSSTTALSKLYAILDQKEASLISTLAKVERFKAGWAEETAFLLGQLKELRAQKELVAFAR